MKQVRPLSRDTAYTSSRKRFYILDVLFGRKYLSDVNACSMFSRGSPGRDRTPDLTLPHIGPRFPPKGRFVPPYNFTLSSHSATLPDLHPKYINRHTGVSIRLPIVRIYDMFGDTSIHLVMGFLSF